MSIVKLVKDGTDVKGQLNGLAFGRDSAFILEEYMDTSGRNTEVVEKIKNIYISLNSKDYDIAERIAQELCVEVGHDDADVVKSRALIARGRSKYKSNQ